jgi:hypothetical protein
MKPRKSPHTFLTATVCSALLLTQAYAQELLLDVKLKVGDQITDTTKITAPLDKETEVQIGGHYKLKVLPTLVAANMVRFAVKIDDSNVNAPMSVAIRTKIGDAAKLLNGFRGNQEIEITAQQK